MLKPIFFSLSLISTLSLFVLPASAKPLNGIYIPFASDLGIEIKDNKFRETESEGSGPGAWQSITNLKEIKKGVVYYHPQWSSEGMYYCHQSLFSFKGGNEVCTDKGVEIL